VVHDQHLDVVRAELLELRAVGDGLTGSGDAVLAAELDALGAGSRERPESRALPALVVVALVRDLVAAGDEPPCRSQRGGDAGLVRLVDLTAGQEAGRPRVPL